MVRGLIRYDNNGASSVAGLPALTARIEALPFFKPIPPSPLPPELDDDAA